MNEDIRNILRKERIKDFNKDIRRMSKKEIYKNFTFGKNKKKLNVPCLVRNLIWQSYSWIQNGKFEPIEGNIRSFWYWSVKPVLSRLNLDVSNKKYTEIVYDMFVKMIANHKLFRYMDFGFIDEKAHTRIIGRKKGNIILFIEKDGLFSILKKIAKKFDVTALSLGGFPSYLNTEYLLFHMIKKNLLREPIYLLGLTDYDPSGWHIEKEFGRQLQEYGINVLDCKNVFNIKDLSDELIEVCKYKLKKTSITKRWIETTGGIEGENFGLEADALGGKRIRKFFEKAIKDYVKKSKKCSVRSSVEDDKIFDFLDKEDKFGCVEIE